MKKIYMDHAATTQLSPTAYEGMLPFLNEQYKNASTLYSSAKISRNALNNARKIIAECINADTDEIFFTSGGSESDNLALKGFVFENWGQDINILTTPIEHHAILHTCNFLNQIGITIQYCNVDSKGVVYNIKSCLSNSSKNLVSIMMANNEIGTIQDIKAISDIIHNENAIFHTDAVQAIGHIPIDLKSLGVDMLSASAHKFNGPKGIGFLYIKKGIKIAPLINGGGQEDGLRAGTENIANIVGMSIALNEACQNIKNNSTYLKNLTDILISRLRAENIDFIINGHANRIPGNISLSIAGATGEGLLHYLDLYGIEVATGSACNSKNTTVSHVLKAINIPDKYINGTIRISLGIENTVDEILLLAEKILKYYQRLH